MYSISWFTNELKVFEERKGNVLSFAGCQFGDAALQSLFTAWKIVWVEQDPRKVELDLTQCEITDDGCKSVWAICSLPQGPIITELNLSENKISSLGCRYLSQIILPRFSWEEVSSLERLDLRDNFIDNQGCEELVEGFTNQNVVNESLTSLGLDDNSVGDDGLVILLSKLQKMIGKRKGGKRVKVSLAKNMIKNKDIISEKESGIILEM